jgi:hypothetical protein
MDMQHIRLAADLAVLDIGLLPSRRLVNRSGIPLAAPGALKSRLHVLHYLRLRDSPPWFVARNER